MYKTRKRKPRKRTRKGGWWPWAKPAAPEIELPSKVNAPAIPQVNSTPRIATNSLFGHKGENPDKTYTNNYRDWENRWKYYYRGFDEWAYWPGGQNAMDEPTKNYFKYNPNYVASMQKVHWSPKNDGYSQPVYPARILKNNDGTYTPVFPVINQRIPPQRNGGSWTTVPVVWDGKIKIRGEYLGIDNNVGVDNLVAYWNKRN